jgi:hypothetical protein
MVPGSGVFWLALGYLFSFQFLLISDIDFIYPSANSHSHLL